MKTPINKEAPLLERSQIKDLSKEIEAQLAPFCKKVRKSGPKDLAHEFLSEARVREQVKLVQHLAGKSLQGTRLLEMGCGYGMFLLGARIWKDILAYGVEPGFDEYMSVKMAQKVLRQGGITNNILISSEGECLPFPSNYFETVYSSNVLEHVKNPQRFIQEAFRVLKPHGKMIIIVPNYLSFWEGHYQLPWLPLLNWLPLGKFYVNLFGRDSGFLETLNLVTPSKLMHWVQNIKGHYIILGTGKDVWQHRMKELDFGSWGGLNGVKSIVKGLKKMHLSEIVAFLAASLNLHTPIILTIEKKNS